MPFQINWQIIVLQLLTKIVSLLVLSICYIIIKKIIFKFIKKTKTINREFDQRTETLYKVLESLINYVLYFLIIYIALSILGVPIATLVAGAGIAGLTIGLGAQGFINDLVNGTFILIERQYDVGDFVIISNIEGRVKSIGLRLTTLIGIDESIYYIRNKDIVIVNNLSKNERRVLVNLVIKNTIDTNIITKTIEQATHQFLKTHPNTPTIQQLGFQSTPSGILYYSIAIFTSYTNGHTLQNELYQHYINTLKKQNIELF